jgi:predicted DNA-binding transcriptional regulator YafY
VFWDRDHWYLVGTVSARRQTPRLGRADRVLALTPHARSARPPARFDIRDYLGRGWLRTAMGEWAEQAPVAIRLSRRQAERVQQDWYYEHATFRPLGADAVLMTFGDDDREAVLALLRWLGPGAELIEPAAWRAVIRDELRALSHTYAADA